MVCIMMGLNLRRLNRTEMCVTNLQGLQHDVEKKKKTKNSPDTAPS